MIAARAIDFTVDSPLGLSLAWGEHMATVLEPDQYNGPIAPIGYCDGLPEEAVSFSTRESLLDSRSISLVVIWRENKFRYPNPMEREMTLRVFGKIRRRSAPKRRPRNRRADSVV